MFFQIYDLPTYSCECTVPSANMSAYIYTNDKKVDTHFFDGSFQANLTVVALQYLRVLYAGYFLMKEILW